MLPCQTDCPRYCAGCHKTCTAWRALQQRQQEDRERRKAYLRRANEACRQVLHSFPARGRIHRPPAGPLIS